MPCFQPLTGYRSATGGKLVFNRSHSYEGATPQQVPCGQCMGCRMAKADEWATRLWHEAQTHETSAFVTLTFADENLPADGSVRTRDVQLFVKRLRKHLGHTRIRFFACGEYGDNGDRPHYHLIVYGYDFPDRTPWRKSSSGYLCFRSATLEKLWPYGFAELGTVTRESLGYVARYVLKKVNGPAAEGHYRRVDAKTGEVYNLKREFITMSTKPGIGAEWYTRYRRDAFPSDYVIVNGQKKPIPRYYTRKLQVENEGAKALDDMHLRVKLDRKSRARKHAHNQTPDRLAIREEVQARRVDRLKRTI